MAVRPQTVRLLGATNGRVFFLLQTLAPNGQQLAPSAVMVLDPATGNATKLYRPEAADGTQPCAADAAVTKLDNGKLYVWGLRATASVSGSCAIVTAAGRLLEIAADGTRREIAATAQSVPVPGTPPNWFTGGLASVLMMELPSVVGPWLVTPTAQLAQPLGAGSGAAWEARHVHTGQRLPLTGNQRPYAVGPKGSLLITGTAGTFVMGAPAANPQAMTKLNPTSGIERPRFCGFDVIERRRAYTVNKKRRPASLWAFDLQGNPSHRLYGHLPGNAGLEDCDGSHFLMRGAAPRSDPPGRSRPLVLRNWLFTLPHL